MIDKVITAQIDPDGRVVRWSGFGEMLRTMFLGLPAEVVEAIRPMVSEEALIARETYLWNGRVGDFGGLDGRTIEMTFDWDGSGARQGRREEKRVYVFGYGV